MPDSAGKADLVEPSTNVFNTSPTKGEMALAAIHVLNRTARDSNLAEFLQSVTRAQRALPQPVEKYLFGRARGGNLKPQASRNSIVPK
jgi:hypothetical protein